MATLVYFVGGAALLLVTLTGYSPDRPFKFGSVTFNRRGVETLGLLGSATIGSVPPSKVMEGPAGSTCEFSGKLSGLEATTEGAAGTTVTVKFPPATLVTGLEGFVLVMFTSKETAAASCA